MKRLGFFLTLSLTPYLFTSVCVPQVTNAAFNGAKYVGEWKDGQPNGQGKLILPNGVQYVGEFRDGKGSRDGNVAKWSGVHWSIQKQQAGWPRHI